MKDKYGVELNIGDIVIVCDNYVFERGVIEDLEEHKVMGLIIYEYAMVNYGKIGKFNERQIIYVG